MELTLQDLEGNIKNLENEKLSLEDEITNLRHYKINYQTLKDTFDLPADKRPKRGFRRPVISTKKVCAIVL